MTPAAVIALCSLGVTLIIVGCTVLVQLGRLLQRVDDVERQTTKHIDDTKRALDEEETRRHGLKNAVHAEATKLSVLEQRVGHIETAGHELRREHVDASGGIREQMAEVLDRLARIETAVATKHEDESRHTPARKPRAATR